MSCSNFERFLVHTSPAAEFHRTPDQAGSEAQVSSSPAQELPPGVTANSEGFFYLRELWDGLENWSAYGAPVPLVLDTGEKVVQYYTPYLSAVELYARGSAESADASEPGTSESGGAPANGSGGRRRILQFFERTPPFSRPPLTDMVSKLASGDHGCPELQSGRSCDLDPASWVAIAWYPLQRIPTGHTLKDMAACFLSYHSLAGGALLERHLGDNGLGTPGARPPRAEPAAPRPEQPAGGGAAAAADADAGDGRPWWQLLGSHAVASGLRDRIHAADGPFAAAPPGLRAGPRGEERCLLPCFGLVTYKLKGNWHDGTALGDKAAAEAVQGRLTAAASGWMRRRGVQHPDHTFFARDAL